ncbi:MAG TPA: hypothetical protein VIF32_09640 [Gemmatimonadaceae bacterium]
MAYTLSLHGRPIGETDFEQSGVGPRQRFGMLRPSEYGLEVLPRLTGFLTAASALKQAIEQRGVDPEDMSADAVIEVLEHSTEGQRMIEVVKALDALELRDSTGARVQFTSIAVSDLRELKRLSAELRVDVALPEDDATPVYAISATFGEREEWFSRDRHRTIPWLRPWSRN